LPGRRHDLKGFRRGVRPAQDRFPIVPPQPPGSINPPVAAIPISGTRCPSPSFPDKKETLQSQLIAALIDIPAVRTAGSDFPFS